MASLWKKLVLLAFLSACKSLLVVAYDWTHYSFFSLIHGLKLLSITEIL
ncbi:Rotenone-insensitive NADH-ubiquinone oxidoreductase mitochondrial [Bienertia sinuspersici]